MVALRNHYLSLSPGSTSEVIDVQVINSKVILTDNTDNTKFGFTGSYAVKPVIYNAPCWWAGGNMEKGTDDLEGYIIKTLEFRLDKIDGVWYCTSAATGGLSLET